MNERATLQNVPQQFNTLLRLIVVSQDAGVAVYEDLVKARVSLSTIDRLMVEADIERDRMHHEGLPVYSRQDAQSFIIGLSDKPYKAPGDPVPVPLPKDDVE